MSERDSREPLDEHTAYCLGIMISAARGVDSIPGDIDPKRYKKMLDRARRIAREKRKAGRKVGGWAALFQLNMRQSEFFRCLHVQ